MDGSWIGDDDRLLAELGEAVRAGRAVPEQFVQIGKAAFAWHDIDAELARLTFDSAPGAGMAAAGAAAAGLRSDRAALRSLTFVSSELTIELEVHPDAIRGQVVPPQPGTVELRGAGDAATTFPVDEVGWFVIRPVPAGAVRLHVRGDAGIAAVTEWITF